MGRWHESRHSVHATLSRLAAGKLVSGAESGPSSRPESVSRQCRRDMIEWTASGKSGKNAVYSSNLKTFCPAVRRCTAWRRGLVFLPRMPVQAPSWPWSVPEHRHCRSALCKALYPVSSGQREWTEPAGLLLLAQCETQGAVGSGRHAGSQQPVPRGVLSAPDFMRPRLHASPVSFGRSGFSGSGLHNSLDQGRVCIRLTQRQALRVATHENWTRRVGFKTERYSCCACCMCALAVAPVTTPGAPAAGPQPAPCMPACGRLRASWQWSTRYSSTRPSDSRCTSGTQCPVQQPARRGNQPG